MLIAAIIVVVGMVGFFVVKKSSFSQDSKKTLSENITSSNTFFLKNDEGLYALFDIDGKNITGFDFKNVGSFVNGTANVENTNKQHGIISTSGKMIVNYGLCKYLFREGPLYECADKDMNEIIMNSSGKTFLKGKDLEVISFIGDYLYAIVEDKYKEEYTVYDYNGKALTSFPISNESGVRSPEANTIENFVSIFYNNTNYIFDISKSKLLVSFEDND